MGDIETAISALTEADTISLSSHVNPDGDSVGSLLGMAMILQGRGKSIYACMPEPLKFPPQYDFLPGRELLADPDNQVKDVDLFIALDCSNRERLGPLQQCAERAARMLNIDHHEDNRLYGDINLVDEHASSTSELVYRVIKAAGWEIDPDVATCLYTGMVTDTGRFEHRNTSPETFAVASELAQAGADISRVIKEVYDSQSLAYTHLMGLALRRIEVIEDLGFAYSFITQRDLAETGATLPETEDLIDHLRSIRGTKVVALFKELADGKIRVSLRSRDAYEIGPVARVMGGGGHAMAAGYTSDNNIEESISDLVQELRKHQA
ncbi:MAG: bifunctional oligoribonuclease/PAP phosphatase NrnA [Actinobacteria bacterium]|nr:bifunctional oligoribonuclease/PAP phosphatase NrnA [Actinomycetota bacterium]